MPSLGLSLQLEEENISDILYLGRVAELEELKGFLVELSETHAATELSIIQAAADKFTGNTCAHYAAANGHKNVVEYLLTLERASTSEDAKSLIANQNFAGNTPLHYAALNGHLDVVKFIVESVSSQSRPTLINCKNSAGHDAAFEAEGNDKSDAVSYLLGVLDQADTTEAKSGEGPAETEHFGAVVDQNTAEGAARPTTNEELDEANERLSEIALDDKSKA